MKPNKTCKNCNRTSEQTDFWQSCKRMCIDCKKKQNASYVERTNYNKVFYNNNKERERARNLDKYHTLKYYDENKKLWRNNQLKTKYGIDITQYKELLEEQNYKCKICPTMHSEEKKKGLHVDHCHTTGNIRGLLCGACNTGLGLLKDDAYLMEKAIEYLRTSKTRFPLK
jgi:Recombination endonuclease VII